MPPHNLTVFNMNSLQKIDPTAQADVDLYGHLISGAKLSLELMLSVMLLSEFINTLLKARCKSIIPISESIRVATMKKIAKKAKFGNMWPGNIGPEIMKNLNPNIYENTGWKVFAIFRSEHSIIEYLLLHMQLLLSKQVVFNGHDGYEVKHGRHQYQVPLEGRIRSCRVWNSMPACCVCYN
ncbi:unnamed protein product [Cuscuta europaea]|uniref:Uncharacterized protein n=1 Tax=Cuscuta europaea TaxID=41803 RepID=A0A9P1E801_CUSEU|nr:unnamed protein product [Cuscuta europaea]